MRPVLLAAGLARALAYSISTTGTVRPRDDGLDAAAAAKAAIDAMNSRFFNASQSRWSPSEPWWVSGVALTTIIDYMRKTSSREYLDQAQQVIQAQRGASLAWWPQGGGEFRADSTDDTGWWALATVRMFDLTGDARYLDMAVEDEAYMHSYWTDGDCGGGVYVDIGPRTYKNAIANELYLKLAASLHNRLAGGDNTRYLERAVRAWSWFRASGMINTEGLVNDGLAEKEDGSCFNNGLPIWTYNQGVLLGGLSSAAQPTPRPRSPRRAPSPHGVLTERCDPDASCDGDQHVFKGIFAANLAELAAAAPAAVGQGNNNDHGGGGGNGDDYGTYLRRNARSVYDCDRGGGGGGGDLYDGSWTGPFRGATLGSQASAAWLFVALI